MNEVISLLTDPQNARRALDLKIALEEKEVTTATAAVSNLTDAYRIKDPRIYTIANTWKLPDRYSMGRTTKVVNPHNPYAWRYSDVTVQCECGALVGASNSYYDRIASSGHTEECTPVHRYDAQSRMWENRERVNDLCSKAYSRPWYMAARMAIGEGEITRIRDSLNYDIGTVKEETRDFIISEVIPALRPEFSRAEVAKLVDVAPSTISRWSQKDYRPQVNKGRAD